MKKTWESPKLIVLVRSRPEESLMADCKDCPMLVPYGPGSFYDGCEISIPEICPMCETYTAS